MKPLQTCKRVAAGQYGTIARRQALAEGMTPRQISRRLASGDWRVEQPATYALADFPRTWWQRAKAAELWGGQGAALAGNSAAFVWGLEGFTPGPIELAAIRRLRSSELVVHYVGPWMEGEIIARKGILVTGAERTIADQARTNSSERLEALLDESLRRRLTTEARMSAYVRSLDGRCVRGIGRLREVLTARVNGPPAESPLETMLARLLRSSNLPQPERQHAILRGGRCIARVDFAWPAYRVAVEAQSRTHHADKTSFERDLGRMNALTEAGWLVIYITWDDVHRRPRETLRLIERSLRRGGLR